MQFSILGLLVVITIFAILSAILLPAIHKARENARRMSCDGNFRQVLLAIHNYHQAHKHLPSAMAGTGTGASPRLGNSNQLSGLVALLPFYESSPLWGRISNPLTVEGFQYPPMGPVPWDKNYPPWMESRQYHVCPSSAEKLDDPSRPFGMTNIGFCIGDGARKIHVPKPDSQIRGMFAPRAFLKFRDVLDGLSYTVAIAEMATSSGRRREGQYAINMPPDIVLSPTRCLNSLDTRRKRYYADRVEISDFGRGGNWVDGGAGSTLIQTILPPNSPSCSIGNDSIHDGIYSASSSHVGGCHVGMGDGRVIFVTESIDSGNSSSRPPTHSFDPVTKRHFESPYGVWGAMGSRSGIESIDEELLGLP